MKKLVIIFVIGLLAVVAWTSRFYWQNLRGIGPAINPPTGDIAALINAADKTGADGATPTNSGLPAENKTGFPLVMPENFSIQVLSTGLQGARVMVFDYWGNLWVSQTGPGKISRVEIKDGKAVSNKEIMTGLSSPHGLAFDPANPSVLYFAEDSKISKVSIWNEMGQYYFVDGKPEKIADLAPGVNHVTRTLGFGPDGRLYVSTGSSCNVCIEKDERRAKIYSMNKDGSDFKEYARGLRNVVFFTWHPKTGKMWATEMGRDLLGDNTPPDEINIVEEGKNYGWPICYGQNIHDTQFDKNTYIRNPCMEPFEQPAKVDLQAHSAPLGLDFVPAKGWPSDYADDLIVAFHGSWNRSIPTGYKLVRIKLDQAGNYQGTEDFISGWVRPGGPNAALGRPAGVTIGPDNNLYVSDDKANLVYKIFVRR